MRQTYEFLFRHKSIEREIMTLASKREAVANCLYLRGISYDGERVQTSPSDMTAEVMARLDEIDRQIDALNLKRLEHIDSLSDLIEKVDDQNERAVLTMYYVAGEPIEKICDKIGYTDRHVFRIKKSGVRKIAQLLSETCQ